MHDIKRDIQIHKSGQHPVTWEIGTELSTSELTWGQLTVLAF